MEWMPSSGAIEINSTTNEDNFREQRSVFTSKLYSRDSIHRAPWLIARAIAFTDRDKESRGLDCVFYFSFALQLKQTIATNSQSSLYKFSSFLFSMFHSFISLFRFSRSIDKRANEI